MWILPNDVLYLVHAPWKYLMLAGQGIAAFLLLYGVLQTDTLSFIGLRQLIELDCKPGMLVTSGLYRFVRHPLYSAGLLFLWLTTDNDSQSVNCICLRYDLYFHRRVFRGAQTSARIWRGLCRIQIRHADDCSRFAFSGETNDLLCVNI